MTGQRVLDPTAVGTVAGDLPLAVAPPGVRAFGHVPDLNSLLPGDLILFSPVSPRWTTRVVASAQRRAGFPQEHCRWTHAAVFLFDSLLVEALPWRGVVQSSLLDYVLGHRMRVRRAPGLVLEERYRVALRALSMLGQDYAHRGIFILSLDLLRGAWAPRRAMSSRAINICSRVFHDAYVETTRHLLDGCPLDSPATPAHLSATKDLEDVEVAWATIR